MKGTALIYRAGKAEPEVIELSASPTLELLQGAVGGYIEAVPGFVTIHHDGAEHNCNAFCNEEGKLNGLPINEFATALWHRALPHPGLRRPDGGLADVLVGNIIIVYGDDEFMEDL